MNFSKNAKKHEMDLKIISCFFVLFASKNRIRSVSSVFLMVEIAVSDGLFSGGNGDSR